MATHVELGERILARMSRIELRRPVVDTDRAGEHLLGYLAGLGLEPTEVRWLPDLRSLRRERQWPPYELGKWPAYSYRDQALARALEPGRGGRRPAVSWRERADAAVLGPGLGRAQQMRSVRRVLELLHRAGSALARGVDVPSSRERHLPALEELSLAAASGLFVFGIGRKRELVAVPRPTLRLDREGLLHDWDGHPAVAWPQGGEGLYYWRGVHMTDSAGRNPDKVTAQRALGWANAERRRVAIERLGWERVLEQLRAQPVQQDDYGRLHCIQTPKRRTRWPVAAEPIMLVEVINATAEPNGTRRRYFLRVPPTVCSAREAVAWTFRFENQRQYVIAAET